LTVSAELK